MLALPRQFGMVFAKTMIDKNPAAPPMQGTDSRDKSQTMDCRSHRGSQHR
jgi:hypothetical protein